MKGKIVKKIVIVHGSPGRKLYGSQGSRGSQFGNHCVRANRCPFVRLQDMDGYDSPYKQA